MVRRRAFPLPILVALAITPGVARAATPPQPVAAPVDPLQAAFEALPEPDRIALQNALVWTGDFNGAVAGRYGPRTHDALLAHAARKGQRPGAALEAASRVQLLAEAETARRAVGFTVSRDTRAGVVLGLPLKLLPVRTALADGTRYASADGAITVETAGRAAAGPEALAAVFTHLTRDAPGRHVAYRLAKPDFVVVSGEEGTRKFYSRSAFGLPAEGGGGAIRSFTLTYPIAAPDLDRIALAVAAAFDPFPPAESPRPPPAPVAKRLAGEALLVGPGLALTRADAAHCDGLDVDGTPARWLRQDAVSGLALLSVPGHPEAAPMALAAAPARPDVALLALFLVPADGPDAAPGLAVAGVSRDGTGGIAAPVQGADAGVALIDAEGALAGLLAPRDGAALVVGSVVAETRHTVIEPASIAALLRDAAVPTRSPDLVPMPAGEAVARWRRAILPLRCRVTP